MPDRGVLSPFYVDVPLRQHRSYLHSTNLFDFLVRTTGARHDLVLSFRRKITSESDAVPAAQVQHPDRCAARFTGKTDDRLVDLVLVEREPAVALSRREPYDEDAAIAGCSLDGSVISSDRDNGATVVERIVALNKRLLASQTQSPRVLLFSSLRLHELPARDKTLKVSLKSRLGQTLFRSGIVAGETQIGEVVFYGA